MLHDTQVIHICSELVSAATKLKFPKYISVSNCQLATMLLNLENVKVNYFAVYDCVQWIFWVAFCKRKITQQQIWLLCGVWWKDTRG